MHIGGYQVGVSERVESYNSAVGETEKAVKEIQEEIFTSVFDSIVNFVSTAAAQAGHLIPTAVLLTGVRAKHHRCISQSCHIGEHARPLKHLLSATLQAGVSLPSHLPCWTRPQPSLPRLAGFDLQQEGDCFVQIPIIFRLCRTSPRTRMRRV